MCSGGLLDRLGPDAHPPRRRGRGRAGEADPGGGRSGRRPAPSEGGGDVQHGGRQVEEEERAAGGPDGRVHHCERYPRLRSNSSGFIFLLVMNPVKIKQLPKKKGAQLFNQIIMKTKGKMSTIFSFCLIKELL